MNTKKILVLQHIAVETPGIILDLMKIKKFEYDCINIREKSNEYNPTNYDALIIMGGPMSVNDKEKYPFIKKEIELVKIYIENNKPILGICLGSQIIASALGSKIYKNSKMELGWHNVNLSGTNDPLFKGIDNQFLAFHWHSDVFSLPNKGKKLASSNLTELQAFNYNNNCYGLLFHLEIDEQIVNNLVNLFENDLIQESLKKETVLNNLKKNLTEVNNTGRIIFNRWLSII